MTFTPQDGGTLVELEHRGFDKIETGAKLRAAVGSDEGWGAVISGLAAAVKAAPSSAPPRYFVCKLITPRPTFMQDMSEKEGEALGAHVAYWTKLVEQKHALIFGPVGDPARVWGLGILTAADEAEARKIAGGDPAVLSGLGFGFEVLPMLRAVVA